jgi:hypothetical protein
MKRASARGCLAAVGVALCAAVTAALLGAGGPQARAAGPPEPAAAHVVIVGISGLTWNLVTPAATPELWRLAAGGSVGSLVDYAQQPLACPADGWLTLNSAARAQGPRPCAPLPAVSTEGRGARVPAMAGIIRDNQAYHESPDWGLLGTLASCATAVGPGAALALASPAGAVSSYLPSPGDLSPSVLARCPLTVVDLGQIHGQTTAAERARASIIDHQLARIAAQLPPGTALLVTAPGAAAGPGQGQTPVGPPHLMSVVVSGPGFAGGLLDSSASRRPGIVTLTDLTPTVAGWLGREVPAGTVGARIGRAARGDLDSTVTGLIARDTAEQVWMSTHGWFFTGYGVADVLALGIPALLFRGRDENRRRRRAQCWRIAGTVAAAVPLGSYLANLIPWWQLAHPVWWLYGMAVAWTLAVAAAALSDMGTFAGNLLHGRGGDLLRRKVTANVGSLTVSALGWLIPVAAAAAGVALWRPSAMRLRMLAGAFEALPLLRVLAWLGWLVLVIGWFADDSGVIVPAAALPFVVPLTIAVASSVSAATGGARYFGSAFAGLSVAG